MRILALDPATKCGWCIGEIGGTPTLGTINLGGRQLDDHADIFARAIAWIDMQLGPAAIMGAPDVLAIEEPVAPWKVLGQTQYAATKIALGLQAIFQGHARSRGIQIITAPIRTWRKYVLMKGDLKTVDAKRAAVETVKRLGWYGDEDHNACEAACIWLYASGVLGPKIATRPEPLFTSTS